MTTLTESYQAFILNQAASDLCALGRLREAVSPMRAAMERYVRKEAWADAVRVTCNLSQLHLVRGDITEAVAISGASVDYADRSGDVGRGVASRTFLATALHQSGESARAQASFEEAEVLQAGRQPHFPRLYSLAGAFYVDLLLAKRRPEEVRERAMQMSEWARPLKYLLDIGLNHLSLGRAALALGEHGEARTQLDEAVDGLRQAGDISYLPRGLLARAALFRETKRPDLAKRDLHEAMRIAKRSEMRLFQCDAHIEYARLALVKGEKEKAHEHVAEARRLVDETGYGRRRPEVEGLEQAVRS